MGTALLQIKDYIQNYIDATNQLLEFDIYITDSNLVRIAGTGQFKELIGLSLPIGSANDYAKKHGGITILDTPTVSDICKNCPIKDTGKCFQEHMIIFALYKDEYFMGNISIVALTDELKEKMKEKESNLIAFLEKFGESILAKVTEKRTTNQFETVISAIHEGIILTDYTGKILTFNKKMKDIIGNRTSIKDFIAESFIDSVFNHDGKLDEHEYEVDVKCQTSNLKMFVSTTYTDHDLTKSDILFTFKDKKEVEDIAYKILADASHLNINIDSIIGNSKQINNTKEIAKQAALYDSNVLILGESGTGKELFARAIHDMSDRKNEPFIAINCAAIPENLLESELFGYESGAFTGAKKGGKPGKFELANGGTIFLDEVGDMSLHLQPKILRVIEYGQLERIGGVSPVDLNVRIIAATNKNLEDMVNKDLFREDLYYRLCVIPIKIKPLRSRPDDILLLAEFFLDKYNEKFKKNIKSISEETKKKFLIYDWPGNVRELENVIEYSVNVEKTDQIILSSIPDKVKSEEVIDEIMNINFTRKKHIENLIKKHGTTLAGKNMIAQELGISLSTLYRNIKKYDIEL